MANTKPYILDIGSAFVLNVGTDITDATLVEIDIKNPDETFSVWTGTVYDTKKILHLIEAGDLPEIGEYLAQARVTTADGFWLGETVKFVIYARFN